MKKLFLALCILFVCSTVEAQNTKNGRVACKTNPDGTVDSVYYKKKKKCEDFVEIRLRGNLSNITGESDSYNGSLFGGQLGAIFTLLPFSDQLSLRAGPMFSMQGAKYGESGGTYSYSGQVRLNYLNIPIVARYQSPGGFYAEAGIQPGFLLSAKDKYDGDQYSAGGTQDIKDQFNTFDVGIPVGIGYQFKNKISVGAGAAFGVTNINKGESTYEANNDKNIVFSFGASYSF